MVTTRKAFTLLELMIVVAIMAALSTLSISGYRALTKGMRDRSAIVAVQTLVDAARQRAEIDRKPMIVYFYDDLLQEANESAGADLVGHGVAIAVRPMGRFSAIDGNYLCDEFGDLDIIYSAENPDSEGSGQQNNRTAMRLYRLADGNYADVKPSVVSKPISASFLLTGETAGDTGVTTGEGGGEKLIRNFGDAAEGILLRLFRAVVGRTCSDQADGDQAVVGPGERRLVGDGVFDEGRVHSARPGWHDYDRGRLT